MHKQLNPVMVFLVLCIMSFNTKAALINDLVVFGDSLSDSGNLFTAIGQPPAPYFQGRFSDGPTYAEHYNDALGLTPLLPSNLGGKNYAWAGARAGQDAGFIPGVQSQVNQYMTSLSPNQDLSNTMHIFFIGGNDIADAVDFGFDLSTASGFLQNSAQKVVDSILSLSSLSPTHILIPEVPDLSFTPRFANSQNAQDFTEVYNQVLKDLLDQQAPNLHIFWLDTSTFLQDIADSFANSIDPCFTQASLCQNPEEYLFFDDFHPSSLAHAAFAEELIAATVNNPTTLLLMMMLMFWFFSKRNQGLRIARCAPSRCDTTLKRHLHYR